MEAAAKPRTSHRYPWLTLVEPGETIEGFISNRIYDIGDRPQDERTIRQDCGDFWRTISRFLQKRTNFFTLHVSYFIAVIFLTSLLLWANERGNPQTGGLWYVDALVVMTSAVCVSGLFSTDISLFYPSSNVLVMFGMIMGSVVLISIVPVIVRRYYLLKLHGSMIYEYRPRLPSRSRSSRRQKVQQLSPYEIDKLEYAAMGKLLIIVPAYWCITTLISFSVLALYWTYSSSANAIMVANGVTSPAWCAIYHAVSGSQNVGFSLFQNNLIPFATDYVVLITLAMCIFLGNTFFPIVLRVIVKVCHRVSKDKTPYRYLLSRPRRCYTMLFPAAETWMLFVIWLVMFISLWVITIGMDWNLPVFAPFSTHQRLLVSFFQTAAIRMGGFNNVDIATMSPSVLFFQAISMYVSVYPYMITLRDSGIMDDDPEELLNTKLADRGAFRRMLTWLANRHFLIGDSILLFTCTVLICIFEDSELRTNPNYSLFKIIYEVASGFGTVGVSLGYPGIFSNFCTVWSTPAKVMICVTMLLGRHRGMPHHLDHAIRTVRDRTTDATCSPVVTPASSPVPSSDFMLDDTTTYTDRTEDIDDRIALHQQQDLRGRRVVMPMPRQPSLMSLSSFQMTGRSLDSFDSVTIHAFDRARREVAVLNQYENPSAAHYVLSLIRDSGGQQHVTVTSANHSKPTMGTEQLPEPGPEVRGTGTNPHMQHTEYHHSADSLQRAYPSAPQLSLMVEPVPADVSRTSMLALPTLRVEPPSPQTDAISEVEEIRQTAALTAAAAQVAVVVPGADSTDDLTADAAANDDTPV